MLPKIQSLQNGTHSAANLPENKPTNRFRDIIPYDDTRVVLKSGPRDYINASYVDVRKLMKTKIREGGEKHENMDIMSNVYRYMICSRETNYDYL